MDLKWTKDDNFHEFRIMINSVHGKPKVCSKWEVNEDAPECIFVGIF